MAFVSQLSQFTLSVVTPQTQFTPRASVFEPNCVKIGAKRVEKTRIWTGELVRERPSFRVRAGSEEELGPKKEEGPAVAVVKEVKAVAEEVVTAAPREIDRLKKALVTSFNGTDRGLSATSETRAKITELITQLEAKKPIPARTEALTLLNGKWILAYTCFAGLFPLLSKGTLPLVTVEEISQIIDSENVTVENIVLLAGPLATTPIGNGAKFEVRSPKSVQMKFEEGIIGTPQLTDSIVIPENVELLGQKIDLSPFEGLINSVQDTASSVAKTISSQPPLKVSFSKSNPESWLLTTYLDEELRISREDGGGVFVLIKEGSSLLTT
ncbi:plastid-lipid-associated protein, chloroplastic-like [Quercus lobata]|uniref:Plastid lipid-associated protein/fibrillin conserved domain-containing protein n=1 Tax=Quercus lobata TaxID=97700 RepID=A0A7N2R5G7_QUELO|nr:plastid-lipid-associated protein, chloroplastic-like [Quercus lobata]